MTIKGRNVGFLGAGNMGEALIKGLLGAKLVPAEAIHATDVRLERLKELDRQYGIQVSSDNADLVRHADIVILAVKPQIMESVLKQVAPMVTRRQLLISLAQLVGQGHEIQLLAGQLVLQHATRAGQRHEVSDPRPELLGDEGLRHVVLRAVV